MKVVSAVWKNISGKLVIKAFDKKMESKYIIPKISPYFYIRKKDLEEAKKVLKPSMGFKRIVTGDYYAFNTREELVKVECKFPSDVRTLRDNLSASGIMTYEADIRFVRRWIIDEKIPLERNPNVLFWDMEVDARQGLAMPDNPTARIISIAGVDIRGREYFICDNDEIEVITKFLKIIKNYPVLIGYNSANWDLPYLIERTKLLGISYPFHWHQHLDMMEMYKKSDYGSYSSLKLDDVAKRELGVGKTFDIGALGGAEVFWEMFLHEREKLKEYNLQDARLLKMLEDKLHLLQVRLNISQFASCLLEDTFYVSRIIDNIMLKRLRARAPPLYVLCNRRAFVKKESFSGGYVYQPERNVYSWVYEYDFKSLYPTIMITFNIGIDTKSPDGDILTERARFTSEYDAEVVKMLKELLDLRTKAKKERNKYEIMTPEWNHYHALQTAYKLIMNSSFGALGERSSRMFDIECAESITLTGQAIMKEVFKIVRELGGKPLYCDTDSVFAIFPRIIKNKSPEEIKRKAIVLEGILNKILKHRLIEKYNIPPERYVLFLEFSNLFSRMFFTGKKKQYIGRVYEREKTTFRESLSDTGLDTSISVVGMQMKKYNTCKFLKTAQKKMVTEILNSESLESAVSKIQDICLRYKKMLYAGILDEHLVQRTGIRKDIEEYKGNCIQLKLAKQLQEKRMFRRGDVIDYVVIGRDKNGNIIPVVVTKDKKFPKIRPDGYKYYEEALINMAEQLIGSKLNLSCRQLKEWFE